MARSPNLDTCMAPRMVRSMWPLRGGRGRKREERWGKVRGGMTNVRSLVIFCNGVNGVPSFSEFLIVNVGLCVSGELKTQI